MATLSTHKKITGLILAVVVTASMILWWINGFSSQVFQAGYVQTYEYTVWGDSTDIMNLASVRMVQLSEMEAVRASMLILQNKNSELPFQDLSQERFYLLSVGDRLPYFEEYVNYYAPVGFAHAQTIEDIPALDWSRFSKVILALNAAEAEAEDLARIAAHVKAQTEVVLVNFDRYEKLIPLAQYPSIIQVPSSQSIAQMVAAQVLFGGVPVYRSISQEMSEVLGITEEFYAEKIRLGYTDPERVGISGDSLQKIDEILREAMNAYAFPGGQVLVARKGQVIYHKSFGYHTYERKRPVRKQDLYDIASITKVAGTTLASMRLFEQGKIHQDSSLASYFQDASFAPTWIKVSDTFPKTEFIAGLDALKADTTREWTMPDTLNLGDSLVIVQKWRRGRGEVQEYSEVFDIRLGNLLTHTSGLPPSLPVHFYQGPGKEDIFSQVADKDFGVPVARNFYLENSYIDSLWNETKSLRVDTPNYCYSCVNMVLMQRVIDSINQASIQQYLTDSFYAPLGLQTLTFNPLKRFPKARIVPTASDRWRGQLIHGTVHDPIAAMMGGISGNAGLFSNANDLAILGQMWLQGGDYGGERFLQDTTVEKFVRRQRGHRGYGFDKPPRSIEYIIAPSAPLSSYGHTGFTGTCMWVDPENELVYVFLSNRIHPSVSNSRINEMQIRQRVHQVIYDALGVPWRQQPKPKTLEEEDAMFMQMPDLLFTP
ncbi:MAG: serine hydrolase [Bacteroidota bacterium]